MGVFLWLYFDYWSLSDLQVTNTKFEKSLQLKKSLESNGIIDYCLINCPLRNGGLQHFKHMVKNCCIGPNRAVNTDLDNVSCVIYTVYRSIHQHTVTWLYGNAHQHVNTHVWWNWIHTSCVTDKFNVSDYAVSANEKLFKNNASWGA